MSQPPATSVSHKKRDLLLISFTILFLELALIRFVPAYVRYLGYFTNVILLGAFLGIGVGCLMTNAKQQLLPWFGVLFFILVLLIKFFSFELVITSKEVVYFTSNTGNGRVESFLLLPVVFTVITVLFASLSQRLGKLLASLPPLTAYTFDIVGSILGIAVFTLLSFFNSPALVWFILIGLLYLFQLGARKKLLIGEGGLLIVSLIFIAGLDDLPTTWSPYQKVAPYSVSNPRREPGNADTHWRLYVNNISHQEMTSYSEVAPFYTLHYSAFPAKTGMNSLIVGSGSGQDVNVALKQGIDHIDAVEIDPVIAEFGKKLHPESPYQDSRVRLIINDARSFLENTTTRYNYIVFALPDSTVLSTSITSLRLESYLFTTEAFAEVREHLTPDGLFVLYNFYRSEWLVDKIAQMLTAEFGQAPLVAHYEDNLAVFITGPRAGSYAAVQPFARWQAREALKRATDDWPFLYLKEATIPRLYLKALGVIGLVALLSVWIATKGTLFSHFSGDFFFLGAAFLLIETKSIVNFNLLFGATWLTNALVFTGILTSVLVAIWINRIFTITRIWPWVILLVMTLLANYIISVKSLLFASIWLRFAVATIFFFSPIFLANLIFANLFKRAKNPADNFGMNLVGAFVGGVAEYTSIALGYQNLILVALIFYILAFLFIRRRLHFSGG